MIINLVNTRTFLLIRNGQRRKKCDNGYSNKSIHKVNLGALAASDTPQNLVRFSAPLDTDVPARGLRRPVRQGWCIGDLLLYPTALEVVGSVVAVGTIEQEAVDRYNGLTHIFDFARILNVVPQGLPETEAP